MKAEEKVIAYVYVKRLVSLEVHEDMKERVGVKSQMNLKPQSVEKPS